MSIPRLSPVVGSTVLEYYLSTSQSVRTVGKEKPVVLTCGPFFFRLRLPPGIELWVPFALEGSIYCDSRQWTKGSGTQRRCFFWITGGLSPASMEGLQKRFPCTKWKNRAAWRLPRTGGNSSLFPEANVKWPELRCYLSVGSWWGCWLVESENHR